MTSALATAPKADRAAIVSALRVFIPPGQTTELRALAAVTADDRRPHVESGYFDDLERMADAIMRIKAAKGIYFTPNPVNPDLMARAENRSKSALQGALTSDADITRRSWLLIDADPIRPADVSSSDAQHEQAILRVKAIGKALRDLGWPDPVMADSGNGAHLLYRIDLPTDDGGLVQRCLDALAFRFADADVSIDQKVFNPARIWKAYGTVACKGDHTATRPHRLARVLHVPAELAVVPVECMQDLAASLPSAPPREVPKRTPGTPAEFDLDAWITAHHLDVTGPSSWSGGRKWVFRECPWKPEEHRNLSAYLVQFTSGAIAAGCHHNGCSGNDWTALREMHDPAAFRQAHANGTRPPSANGPRPAEATEGIAFEPEGFPEPEETESVGWPAALDEAAYYGLAGEVVRLIEPQTEADPVALLLQFLAAFGSAVGRGPFYRVGADKHYTNLFIVLVGASGKGRKGTSFSWIKSIFKWIDIEWSQSRVLSGLSSGEGLIYAVRDPVEGKSEKKSRSRYGDTEDAESVLLDPGVADKRLFLIEPEFSTVLAVMDRQGSTLSHQIRQAWETGDMRILNKNSPLQATGAHITIAGHITKDELLKRLTETESANGFANRFIFVAVRRSKCLPEGGYLPDGAFTRLSNVICERMGFARSVTDMHRDDAARRLWAELYPELSEGKPGLYGAVVGRAEAQVLRLSLNYALLDESAVVRVEHLKAALALWRHSEQSDAFIFGRSVRDARADDLLAAIRNAPAGLTGTEISSVFHRNVPHETLSRLLETLKSDGVIESFTEQTGGRPTRRWKAVLR